MLNPAAPATKLAVTAKEVEPRPVAASGCRWRRYRRGGHVAPVGSVGVAWFGRSIPLALVVGVMAATGAQTVAYLPVLGPPPLRFEPTRKRPAHPLVLPPLVEPQSKATNSTTPTEPPTPAALTANANPAKPATAGLTPAVTPGAAQPGAVANATTNAVSTVVASEPPSSSDNASLTPQMLLQYFQPPPGGTNRAGVGVVAPFGFLPPAPPPPPSSTATYKVQ